MNTDTAITIPQGQTPLAVDEHSRLSPAELADLLKSEYPNFPARVIREVQCRGMEMIPQLIRLIEEATDNAKAGKTPRDTGHFLALPLLIEFQAEEALDAILRSVCLPGKLSEELYGDAKSEVLFRVVPALASNRVDAILEIVRNPQVDTFVRWAMIHGLRHLRDVPGHSHQETALILQALLREAIGRNDGSSVTFVTCEACMGGFTELLEDIRAAYQRDLVDEDVVGSLASVEHDILKGNSFESDWRIVDTVDYMADWYCFQPDEDIDAYDQGKVLFDLGGHGSVEVDNLPDDASPMPPTATIRYDEPHVRRNDPCPCGSGKKFKKCCGRAGSLPEL